MSYIGNGFGSYVQEVTYRYVGAGGSFDVVRPRRVNVCVIGSIGVALLVVVIVLIMWPWDKCSNVDSLSETELANCCNLGKIPADQVQEKCENVNNPCEDLDAVYNDPDLLDFCCDLGEVTEGCQGPPSARAECVIWGDPHVKTFDLGHADFYSEGEVWMVKSQSIHIQARYKATPFTDGLAATETLAVGGSFIGNNVLKVGPMNGQITWNDGPILTTKGSSFSADGAMISYNGEGNLLDDAMGNLEKNIVHIDLPKNMHIQIMRWSHHINVKIEMSKALGGQDGHCGNFNGNSADDSTAAIIARMGRGVSPAESLFNNYVPYHETKKVSLRDCAPGQRAQGQRDCARARPGLSGQDMEDCIIDFCVAGARYAIQDSAY